MFGVLRLPEKCKILQNKYYNKIALNETKQQKISKQWQGKERYHRPRNEMNKEAKELTG